MEENSYPSSSQAGNRRRQMNILEENQFITVSESDDAISLQFKKTDFGKSFKQFMKDFPGYATDAVQIGADAIAAYKSAKTVTARFFAKTPLEKKLYGDIVNTLVKHGKFRQVTKKIQDGGIFYELVKT